MRIPVISIIFLFIVSFTIDYYIFNDICRFCRDKKKKFWSKFYLITSVALWIFLIVTLLLPRRSESAGILTVMWMLYTYLTVYVSKLIYVICSAIGRFFRSGRSGINRGIYVGVPLGLLCFITLWYGALFTRDEIWVNRVVIESGKLPESFNGYRIVQFSDAHVGTWGNDTTFISTLVDSIQSLNPDLIVFTGDIVNRQSSELEPFLKTLSRLKAPDGVYSILGNHDYGDYIDWKSSSDKEENRQLLLAWQRQIGWKTLNNEHTFISNKQDSIVLIGVENWGEPPFKQYGKLTESYPAKGDSTGSLNDGRYKILLSHNPEHWNQEVTNISNIDLTLSGHTHAMQIMLGNPSKFFWSPAKYRYEQWGGLYERENIDGQPMSLYVNIGSGEVGMPARIGSAYPEITLIELKRK